MEAMCFQVRWEPMALQENQRSEGCAELTTGPSCSSAHLANSIWLRAASGMSEQTVASHSSSRRAEQQRALPLIHPLLPLLEKACKGENCCVWSNRRAAVLVSCLLTEANSACPGRTQTGQSHPFCPHFLSHFPPACSSWSPGLR